MNNTQEKDLDVKALGFIEEQLEQELLLYKKYLYYSEMFFDSELKNICYNSSKKHKENFNKLLTYLNS